jgi:hypothetical protein
MRFFQIYQVVAPATLLPLSYWLWWQRYAGVHRMVWLSLSLPIVFAYVIPYLGTNWLRLWEFNTRLKVKGFRPHHGLVFGTATSLLAIITLVYPGEPGVVGILRGGFLLGCVLGFWNWLYDTYAIKSGFIRVYTRPQAEQAGAEAIATSYAPVLFGVFGFCYGTSLRSLEHVLIDSNGWHLMWLLLPVCHAVCLGAPVAAYVFVSFLRTGQSGLQSYERIGHGT